MTHLQEIRSRLRKFKPSTKEAEGARDLVIADIDKQEAEEEIEKA